jgi:hypothetical protein
MNSNQAAYLRHAEHYSTVAQQAEDFYAQGNDDIAKGLKLFGDNWANIRAAQKWSALKGSHDTAAELCVDFPSVPFFAESLPFTARKYQLVGSRHSSGTPDRRQGC